VKSLRAYLSVARLNNAVLPAVGIFTGFVSASGRSYALLVLTILMFVLVHSVVTIWNDIADEAGDRFNDITRLSAIKKAGAYRGLVFWVWSSLAAIVAISWFLPGGTKLLLLASLVLGWLYNVRPVQASHRPLLSIVVLALAYGAVPFALGISLGHLGVAAACLLASWTIGRGSLSLLKDYKDAKGDVQAKKRTFLLVYGGTLTARWSFGLAVGSYAVSTLVVAFNAPSPLQAAPLCLAAVWLLYERFRLFKESQYAGLDQVFHDCVKYQLLFDVLVAICLRTS